MPSEFVDTDADVTIVSANLFDKVALTNSPDICPSSGDIKGLNRQVIPVTGQTTVEVGLGRTVSKVNVWIASIDEQCILGSDYFKDQGCIIDYSKQMLHVKDTEVPMQMVKSEKVPYLRIIVTNTVRISPNQGMVIPAKVDGDAKGLRWGTTAPPSLEGRNDDLMIGRTLVDINKDCIPIRVANLSNGRKKLKQGTEIAV